MIDFFHKTLWLVCLFLIVGATTLVANFGRSQNDTKQVAGQANFNITELKVQTPPKLPTQKENVATPAIFANAVLLMDAETFYPLYAKAENQKMPIASTTKIATALVVLEDYKDKLNEVVTITPKMIAVEGSDIQLRPGEKITVENLLKGLLIMSGNDTAYALADHFGGRENFVSQMNAKVKKIGLQNTQYQDPAGLNDNGYSTAKELAILAAYALRQPKFAEVVKTSETTVYSADGRIAHELKNSNRMLRQEEQYFFPYAIGVKTGFTFAAGHVLVSAAQKDNRRLIAVVLNTNENTIVASAKESKKLLEWGFANWTW